MAKKKKTIWAKRVHIPSKWINKFTIVGAVFLIWITFFDSHNLIDTYKVSKNLDRMEEEKEDQIQKIAEAKQNWIDLDENKEKFAREKYFMHKADEEIFIIEKSIK
jgi:cell division protein FtsB